MGQSQEKTAAQSPSQQIHSLSVDVSQSQYCCVKEGTDIKTQ